MGFLGRMPIPISGSKEIPISVLSADVIDISMTVIIKYCDKDMHGGGISKNLTEIQNTNALYSEHGRNCVITSF